MDRDQAVQFMHNLLRAMLSKKASDLFITAGFPPAFKVDGTLMFSPGGRAGEHRQMVLVDGPESAHPLTADHQSFLGIVAPSPDGRRVVAARSRRRPVRHRDERQSGRRTSGGPQGPPRRRE